MTIGEAGEAAGVVPVGPVVDAALAQSLVARAPGGGAVVDRAGWDARDVGEDGAAEGAGCGEGREPGL